MITYARRAPDAVAVGVDGSPGDRKAIAWAVRAAASHGLPVRLVHAHPHAYDLGVTDRVHTAEELVRSLAPDVVVGTSGQSGPAGLLRGSTSQALLYELPCPLAIVPASVT